MNIALSRINKYVKGSALRTDTMRGAYSEVSQYPHVVHIFYSRVDVIWSRYTVIRLRFSSWFDAWVRDQ